MLIVPCLHYRAKRLAGMSDYLGGHRQFHFARTALPLQCSHQTLKFRVVMHSWRPVTFRRATCSLLSAKLVGISLSKLGNGRSDTSSKIRQIKYAVTGRPGIDYSLAQRG